MKIKDIKIGEKYGKSRWEVSSASSYGLEPITVTGTRKEERSVYGTYGRSKRTVTVIVGTDQRGDEVTTESRYIRYPWADVVAAREQAARWKVEAQDADTRRRNELDPVIERVEQALRARGHEPRSRYLGFAYVHTTGEVRQDRPKEFDTDVDSGWSHESFSIDSVLDREEILRHGNLTVPVTLLDSLL